jgi:hypothetical protein
MVFTGAIFLGVSAVTSLLATMLKTGSVESKDKDRWSLVEEVFLCQNQDKLVDGTTHNHPVKIKFGRLADLVNEAFHKGSPLQYKFHTAEQVSVKLKNMRSAVKAANNAIARIKHFKPPGASGNELTKEQQTEIDAVIAKCRFYHQ